MLHTTLSSQRINKESPIPFYYQIAQILREAIEDYADGMDKDIALPSEAELCEIFQVNRGTVRHALDTLEREGLVYREKGRGTFVRRRRLELDLSKLCSTTEDLRARGWEPETDVLSMSQMIPRPHIQHTLKLASHERVWNLHRLRLAEGEPISLQRSYIPAALAPDLDTHDLTGSLYYILQNAYGVELVDAEQTIRARVAAPEEAALLGVSECDPLFEISRVTFNPHGHPVEYLDSLWRGDRYDFRVHLQS